MTSNNILAAEDFQNQINRLTEIGIALSGELKLGALLHKALTFARELTHADAGTLYLLQDETLHFRIMQNESLGVFLGGEKEDPVKLAPVPLDKTNVSAYAALLRQTVHIADVYESADFDFSGPRRYDKMTGYRSRSMLVVPMMDHEGEVIGVLQLINATAPGTRELTAFADSSVKLAEALASQAAVAVTNARLVDNVKNLFESLIKVLAAAVDKKSPYTGNHVQRVAKFNVLLAEAINEKTDGPFKDVHFSENELEEIRLAGWLHDVGKVTTPVWVMNKARKLEMILDRIRLLEVRFGFIEKQKETDALEQKLALALQGQATPEALEKIDLAFQVEKDQLRDDLQFLARCNMPNEYMEDAMLERVEEIAKGVYALEGKELPYLTDDEVHNLLIRRGSLTEEQMTIMRVHVLMTSVMLDQVPFDKHLKNVSLYASQHHEKLNGSGYPDELTAKDLPLQSRILAIADFYEALSAKDRPYKKPMSEPVILQILNRSADDGEIDRDVLSLLTQDHIHHRFEKEYEKSKM